MSTVEQNHEELRKLSAQISENEKEIVRLKERVKRLEDEYKSVNEKVDDLDHTVLSGKPGINSLVTEVQLINQKLGNFSRFFWIVISAVVGVAIEVAVLWGWGVKAIH